MTDEYTILFSEAAIQISTAFACALLDLLSGSERVAKASASRMCYSHQCMQICLVRATYHHRPLFFRDIWDRGLFSMPDHISNLYY